MRNGAATAVVPSRCWTATTWDYSHHDIESEEGAAEKAEQISGQKHIPVLLFEDGTVFVEPTNPQLTGKLKELGLIE